MDVTLCALLSNFLQNHVDTSQYAFSAFIKIIYIKEISVLDCSFASDQFLIQYIENR